MALGSILLSIILTSVLVAICLPKGESSGPLEESSVWSLILPNDSSPFISTNKILLCKTGLLFDLLRLSVIVTDPEDKIEVPPEPIRNFFPSVWRPSMSVPFLLLGEPSIKIHWNIH